MTSPSFPSSQRQLEENLLTAAATAKRQHRPFCRSEYQGDILQALHLAQCLAAKGHGVAVTTDDHPSHLAYIYLLTGPAHEFILSTPRGERRLYANPPDMLSPLECLEGSRPDLPGQPSAVLLPFRQRARKRC